jgi:DNA-directed RNA polymerase subunit RPC12/RpoP
MTCDSCRKAVPISDLKYMLKGDSKMVLCSACRSKQKMKDEKKGTMQDKKPYFCVRCKYKFKYKPSSQTVLRCPYCGKGDKIIEDIAPDADKLLKEMDME